MTAVQYSIRILIAICGAFFLAQYLQWSQGYWLVLSAVLLMQIRIDNFFWKNSWVLLLSGILMAVNVCLANGFASIHYLLPFYLFLTTLVTVCFSLIKTEYFLSAFFVNLVGIIAAGMPVSGAVLWARVECVFFGILLALLVGCLCWPPRLYPDLKQQLRNCFSNLDELQKKLFFIYLKRDYAEQHFFYERDLHQQRELIFFDMKKMNEALEKLAPAQANNWRDCFDHLNHLFDIIIALGNLRYRIQDQATFEVCEKELALVSIYISKGLDNLTKQLKSKKAVEFNLDGFVLAIRAVEEIYRSTLQVVSKDPLVFLLFIQNLYAVQEELNSLANDVEKL